MADYDAVLVGSGINSLAAAAMLAKAGWRVCVLERNDYLGGAVKTAELTAPGFHHDVYAGWFPAWVGGAAHTALGDDLAARGVEFLDTQLPTGSLYPDGSAAFLLRSTEANAAEFERHARGDGDAWKATADGFLRNADLLFGLSGTELWSPAGLGLAARAYWRLGRRGLLELTRGWLVSCRDWASQTFASDRVHGLLAPWVLHAGLGPDHAASGFAAQMMAVATQQAGEPIPCGGAARVVDALVALVRDLGGACEIGADVERVLVERGRAIGVRVAGGAEVTAKRAVLCDVTPTQLYGRLLEDPPAALAAASRRYRYGRGEMQIHLALSEPPAWQGDERLSRTAILHVTPGLDGVSRAVNEADRGLLPAEATIVCGQPLTMDESRAPSGCGLLWIQLQELPRRVKGDAAGRLDTGDGAWTQSLREAYADRIVARLAPHAPNLESSILARVVLSPADLEAANVNFVGGDPYGGALSLDQSFLWRPFPQQPGHRTPVAGLYHIGASTHPGAGLGAGSGTMVARELLAPPLLRTAIDRLRGIGRP